MNLIFFKQVQTAHLIIFLPYCLQIIEKAQIGTSQNSPIFNEALCASLVLAVYLNADISLGKFFFKC